MSNLMNLGNTPLTMSSREIADLTGKRHDNVMVLCRSLRDMGVCPEIQETPYVNEQNGQTYLECRLGKRDSLVLIARISPEFTAAVVDRWQELEAQQPPVAIPDFTNPAEAARAWAAEFEAKQQAQQALALAAPKVEFVDKFVQASTGSKTFRQVAKLLKANEREFRAFLENFGVMYRLGGEWMPYAQHLDAGRFEVKTGVAGNEHAYTATRFTAKGVEWIAGEWGKHQVLQQVAA